jgi:hypothetical protein
MKRKLCFTIVVSCIAHVSAIASFAAVKPKTPTNLSATAASQTQINLTWTDNSGIETGYTVERATSSAGPWTQIATLSANATSCSNTGLTASTTYYYRVRASTSSANSSYSNTASATTTGSTTAPSAPSNLTGTAASSSQVNLTWTDNSSNESGFSVQRASSSSGPWSQVALAGINATAHADTGLSPSTSYYYRLCATNSAGASAFTATINVRTATGTVVSVKPPRGIYMLDANSGSYRLGILSKADLPYVDGYAWRMQWTAFASGTTTGVYNFAGVDAAISQLQALRNNVNNRMKLTLALFVQQPPTYVLSKAQETFQTKLPGGSGLATAPVPWDANTLAEYAKFTKALGDHQVYDAVSGTSVQFRNHPALGQINAGIIGLQGLRDLSGNLTVHPSYTRPKFIDAVLDNIHAVHDQFPNKPTYVAYFSMKDGTRNPSLDEELLAAINTEFDGRDNLHARLGLFQEALRGDNPIPGGNGLADNLIEGRAGGAFIMFQACGPWLTKLFCDWLATDNTPANGLNLGYGTYGALYYELYEADITHSGYTSTLQQWHDFLQAAP